MIQKVRFCICLIFTLFGVSGCSSDSSNSSNVISPTSATNDIDLPSNPSGDTRLLCEQLQYPCSPDAVPQAITERSEQVAQNALDIINNESSVAAIDWLNTQSDVVASGMGENTLVFRIAGGRPHWVISSDALGWDEDAASSLNAGWDEASASRNNAGIAADASLLMQRVKHNTASTRGIVGEDADQKKALLLSPYAWQFRANDDTNAVSEILKETRGYKGNVDVRENRANNSIINIDQFKIWSDYDVVHVSSHGDEIIMQDKDGVVRGQILLMVGPRNDEPANQAAFAGQAGVFQVTHNGASPRTKLSSWAIGEDFFSLYYPEGLDRSIIYFSSCKTSADNSSFPTFFGAEDGGNVFLSWDNYVGVKQAKNTATGLYSRLSRSGRRITKVYDDMVEDGLAYDEIKNALFTLDRGKKDLRLREIITAYTPTNNLPTEADPLNNGALLPIVGVYDDGKADKMRFTVQIDGVEEDELDDFIIRISVNGNEALQPFDLSTATPVYPPWSDPKNYSYQLTDVADFNFDFPSSDLLDVRFWVELPEGGESEFNVSLASSSWSMGLTGPNESGLYIGERATLYPSGGLLIVGSNDSNDGKSASLTAEYDPLFVDGTTQYALGLTSSGGSRSRINVFDANANGPDAVLLELRNGDGSTVSIAGGLSSFTYPPSPTLTIEDYNKESLTVSGSVVGTYFSYDGTNLYEYSTNLQFNAVNCDHSSRPAGCFLGQ